MDCLFFAQYSDPLPTVYVGGDGKIFLWGKATWKTKNKKKNIMEF